MSSALGSASSADGARGLRAKFSKFEKRTLKKVSKLFKRAKSSRAHQKYTEKVSDSDQSPPEPSRPPPPIPDLASSPHDSLSPTNAVETTSVNSAVVPVSTAGFIRPDGYPVRTSSLRQTEGPVTLYDGPIETNYTAFKQQSSSDQHYSPKLDPLIEENDEEECSAPTQPASSQVEGAAATFSTEDAFKQLLLRLDMLQERVAAIDAKIDRREYKSIGTQTEGKELAEPTPPESVKGDQSEGSNSHREQRDACVAPQKEETTSRSGSLKPNETSSSAPVVSSNAAVVLPEEEVAPEEEVSQEQVVQEQQVVQDEQPSLSAAAPPAIAQSFWNVVLDQPSPKQADNPKPELLEYTQLLNNIEEFMGEEVAPKFAPGDAEASGSNPGDENGHLEQRSLQFRQFHPHEPLPLASEELNGVSLAGYVFPASPYPVVREDFSSMARMATSAESPVTAVQLPQATAVQTPVVPATVAPSVVSLAVPQKRKAPSPQTAEERKAEPERKKKRSAAVAAVAVAPVVVAPVAIAPVAIAPVAIAPVAVEPAVAAQAPESPSELKEREDRERWGEILELRNRDIAPVIYDLFQGAKVIQMIGKRGSFHRCWIVTFESPTEGEMKVVVRISIRATRERWTGEDAWKLKNDSRQLKWLSPRFSCAAKVYAFSTDFDNSIGRPYQIQEYKEGISLDRAWNADPRHFGFSTTFALQKQLILNVAEKYRELSHLGDFRASGGLYFNTDDPNAPPEVGPFFQEGCHERNLEPRFSPGAADFGQVLASKFAKMHEITSTKPCKPDEALVRTGAVWLIKSFLKKVYPSLTDDEVDRQREMLEDDEEEVRVECWQEALGQIIRHSSDDTTLPRFLIKHPDFNWQNILINDKGEVVAFIDMDQLSVVPAELACAAPPFFMYPDWNPCYKHLIYDPSIKRSSLQDAKMNRWFYAKCLENQPTAGSQDLYKKGWAHVLAAIWEPLKEGNMNWLIMVAEEMLAQRYSESSEKSIEAKLMFLGGKCPDLTESVQKGVMEVIGTWMEQENADFADGFGTVLEAVFST
ncbi:hypothetical protein BT63DRAFT_414735 [Microthyrium microscopicum]|uniref:Aminoglycoside phosphotransferase domain-containing protein n=1 Tax=Microthyrium microscopicum TaxID=703497 RepID=A0A6A6U9Z8_9PEZI|nr:hypothetical protein BT63DRAFT_414735 [Microthyrium microscopicum]